MSFDVENVAQVKHAHRKRWLVVKMLNANRCVLDAWSRSPLHSEVQTQQQVVYRRSLLDTTEIRFRPSHVVYREWILGAFTLTFRVQNSINACHGIPYIRFSWKSHS